MNRYISSIRKLVKRAGSEHYLLIMLLSFAGSISVTRIFLELTGYPQVSPGELHIAHVLWGGLLLFIATLLPLIYSNRWIYSLTALLSGVGVGLFIDEVGKFITKNNDYKYPAAAPVIYAFFLLTVLLFLRVRRPPHRDARTELYRALDGFEDVLDHDLDANERADLIARLNYVVSHTDDPDLNQLARSLLSFVSSDQVHIIQTTSPFLKRLETWLFIFEDCYITRRRFRAGVAITTGVMGVVAMSKIAMLAFASFSNVPLQHAFLSLVDASFLQYPTSLGLFLVTASLNALVGLILLISAFMLLTRKERTGVTGSYLGLLVCLTILNIMLFYYDQFSTISVAVLQFGTLMGVLHYRRRYLIPNPLKPPPPCEKDGSQDSGVRRLEPGAESQQTVKLPGQSTPVEKAGSRTS